MQPSGTVRLQGHGVSVWLQQTVDFVLSGEFSADSGDGRLIKRHQGEFNNTIEYAFRAQVDEHTRIVALLGGYDSGEFRLSRLCGA